MIHTNKIQSFSDVLQKGLGRAFDYIKQQDKLEIRTDLLNACLHNLAYDPQCESRRGEWLFKLIHLTDDVEFYRERIFQALTTTDEFWDLVQLYDLVLIWAKKGDIEAKKIIYSTFEKQDFNESWLGGEQIIELDGIKGLLAVAEIVGDKLLKDNDCWEDDELIHQASESFGKDEVWSALEKESLNNIKVKAYLDAVKSHEENLVNVKERRKNIRKAVDFDTIIQQIEDKQTHYTLYLLRKFGLYAPDDDIERVFEKLLLETRKQQLIRYLWIFKYRQFPRLNGYLLDLAENNDAEIQSRAIIALANYQDNSLRNLAIKLIKQQPKSIENRVLELFIKNYQLGDIKLIESILKTSHDIDTRHYLGMDLMEIIDENKHPELINCSFWIYENTPCAYCRQKILEILIDLQYITSEIIKECMYDCSLEIQDLCKNLA